jgi:hypothetical protein
MEQEIISTHPFLQAELSGGFPGSILLHRDVTPLDLEDARTAVILTHGCNSIGGDIYADQACTLKVYTSADGDNFGTPALVAVPAGQPLRFEYPGLFCRAVKVEVANNGAAMTEFRLYIRGGA